MGTTDLFELRCPIDTTEQYESCINQTENNSTETCLVKPDGLRHTADNLAGGFIASMIGIVMLYVSCMIFLSKKRATIQVESNVQAVPTHNNNRYDRRSEMTAI